MDVITSGNYLNALNFTIIINSKSFNKISLRTVSIHIKVVKNIDFFVL